MYDKANLRTPDKDWKLRDGAPSKKLGINSFFLIAEIEFRKHLMNPPNNKF